MLSSVPTRLIARRSRSLSPCSRVLQTSASGAARQGTRENPAETNRNPIVSTSRVSRRGILAEDTAGSSPVVQYHHLAPRWLSNLENRRNSWASLAGRGRNNNHYWEKSGGGGTGGGAGRAGVASAGVLSAAALAFCLKKDSDNKGRFFFNLIYSKKYINIMHKNLDISGTHTFKNRGTLYQLSLCCDIIVLSFSSSVLLSYVQ